MSFEDDFKDGFGILSNDEKEKVDEQHITPRDLNTLIKLRLTYPLRRCYEDLTNHMCTKIRCDPKNIQNNKNFNHNIFMGNCGKFHDCGYCNGVIDKSQTFFICPLTNIRKEYIKSTITYRDQSNVISGKYNSKYVSGKKENINRGIEHGTFNNSNSILKSHMRDSLLNQKDLTSFSRVNINNGISNLVSKRDRCRKQTIMFISDITKNKTNCFLSNKHKDKTSLHLKILRNFNELFKFKHDLFCKIKVFTHKMPIAWDGVVFKEHITIPNDYETKVHPIYFMSKSLYFYLNHYVTIDELVVQLCDLEMETDVITEKMYATTMKGLLNYTPGLHRLKNFKNYQNNMGKYVTKLKQYIYNCLSKGDLIDFHRARNLIDFDQQYYNQRSLPDDINLDDKKYWSYYQDRDLFIYNKLCPFINYDQFKEMFAYIVKFYTILTNSGLVKHMDRITKDPAEVFLGSLFLMKNGLSIYRKNRCYSCVIPVLNFTTDQGFLLFETKLSSLFKKAPLYHKKGKQEIENTIYTLLEYIHPSEFYKNFQFTYKNNNKFDLFYKIHNTVPKKEIDVFKQYVSSKGKT